MKRSWIKCSINCLISNKLVEIQIRQCRKFNNLIMEKRIQEGIDNNFKNLITNLTNITLSSSKTWFWTQTWFSNASERIRHDSHNAKYL